MYELSQSLGIKGRKCSYEMYTAVPRHTYKSWLEDVSRVVVGITDSFTAYDSVAYFQAFRQAHFPLPLLEKVVTFKCRKGQASQPQS